MRPDSTRWIGYREVRDRYAAIGRSSYHKLARQGTWGPIARILNKVMVRESAVARWANEQGRTTRSVVIAHIERSTKNDAAVAGGILGRATGCSAASAKSTAQG